MCVELMKLLTGVRKPCLKTNHLPQIYADLHGSGTELDPVSTSFARLSFFLIGEYPCKSVAGRLSQSLTDFSV